MEYRFPISNNVSLLNEENILRDVNCIPKKLNNQNQEEPYVLVLEILQEGKTELLERVIVSVKSKAPAVKSLHAIDAKHYFSKGDIKESSILKSTSRDNKEGCFSAKSDNAMNIKRYVKRNKKDNLQSQLNKALSITDKASEKLIQSENKIILINYLTQGLGHLYQKELNQETVHSVDQMLQSSDEESNTPPEHSRSKSKRTYVNQYSHIAEKSAFNRHSQHPHSSPPKVTIDKNHNSEQYGRDFTTYDEMTARGHRHSASVPLKRNDISRRAAERVHKVRHKLNPVRDYRLMDTVHYLAQGEFAPRDDGVKLTPSREAVLSDIIWEDVCRTNWPSTRLTRRNHQTERGNGRYELQRLIDSLLRERVAHVERRRRKHYRVVKLNHRFEIGNRILGKTGDIIVATQKKKEGRNIIGSDHAAKPINHEVLPICLKHRSHDRNLHNEEDRNEGSKRRIKLDESLPGTSTDTYTRAPIYLNNVKYDEISKNKNKVDEGHTTKEVYKGIPSPNNPRLIVSKKNESSKRKSQSKATNLEHFIVLPTLVVRTPSNVRRQKKFNELYHRILNTHNEKYSNEAERVQKKDKGFNVRMHSSESNTCEDD